MAARQRIDRSPQWDGAERVEVPYEAPTPRAVRVGSVDDPAEAEADRMADRALALSAEYAGGRSDSHTGSVRRSASTDVDGLSVSESALSAASSGGRSLDGQSRARLEQGFGTDLGGVRVHTGTDAAGIARQIHAKAFTHGSDVYFGEGEYRPGTPDGDRVIAHEVAHTVQSGSVGGVHRFPATWSTAPVPWKPMTASVFRPGEGASGGVYILTSKDDAGPVRKAVVKPVSGKNGLGLVESGQQLQFSDVALGKLLGLNAPTSKVVRRGGSEFKDLVDLCKSKQPPPKTVGEGEAPEAKLEDAESFVVMSEVPNASSIASLADKAPTDKRASADLFRAVFDPVFLMELGKLCIGDLMLGNPDRFVLGASNLGNVMVSMQDGRGRIAAIDTTAYLPKAPKPESWVAGWQRGRSEFKDGPDAILDRFFEVLVQRLKQGPTPTDSSMPVWQVIDTTYKTHRDRFVADFDYGWNDAMITAMSLADDDDAINAITSGYSDAEVSSQGLKANLQYLGAKAQGKSHEESIGRSMAITAGGWVDKVDRKRFMPSPPDALHPRSITVPDGKAVTADVVPMPSLPSGDKVGTMAKDRPSLLYDNQFKDLAGMVGNITAAHAEADQEVSSTKKRRTKPFGSKVDVPRNRSVVSHYVAHATAMGLGGNRAADAAAHLNLTINGLKPLADADFRGNEAAPVKLLLSQLNVNIPLIESTVSKYQDQLATAARVVSRTGYHDAAALDTAITKVSVYLTEAEKAIVSAKKSKPQQLASNLKVRPQ